MAQYNKIQVSKLIGKDVIYTLDAKVKLVHPLQTAAC